MSPGESTTTHIICDQKKVDKTSKCISENRKRCRRNGVWMMWLDSVQQEIPWSIGLLLEIEMRQEIPRND
jgi:hypothetical protein